MRPPGLSSSCVATFAVVHGAGDSASSWDLVAGELRERGHDVVAVDLPVEDDAAGWSAYADVVADALGHRDDAVVVAHSLGGFPAPLVCERVPVALLVLVAAMVPQPGERAAGYWERVGYTASGDLDDLATFFHDVPAERVDRARRAERAQSAAPMHEPWPGTAWPDVPTRYLLCRDDRMFTAATTRRVVRERLGIEPDEMAGGHMPFLSRPEELAERLDAYWRDAARTGASVSRPAP